MLDFFNIEKYKENNRLEAKAAAVGLPKSLWATYSALCGFSPWSAIEILFKEMR